MRWSRRLAAQLRTVVASRRPSGQALTTPVGLNAVRQRWPDLVGDPTAAPIFVLSAGWRSGSTLLQRMILSNRRTLVWGEPFAHSAIADGLARQLRPFTPTWPDVDWLRIDPTKALEGKWTANFYPPLESFARAHAAFWLGLLAEPAKKAGWANWGLKETRWGLQEASYLKWLFPRSRFVFVYRDPYEAYASYYRWRNWFWEWPHRRVLTSRQFGLMWRELVSSFVDGYQSVDGFLICYDELRSDSVRARLSDYLAEPLCSPTSLSWVNGHSGKKVGEPPGAFDFARLEATVYPVADKLGFASPLWCWPRRALRRRDRRSASASPSSAA